jgi:hypothetical protein
MWKTKVIEYEEEAIRIQVSQASISNKPRHKGLRQQVKVCQPLKMLNGS